VGALLAFFRKKDGAEAAINGARGVCVATRKEMLVKWSSLTCANGREKGARCAPAFFQSRCAAYAVQNKTLTTTGGAPTVAQRAFFEYNR
jgi:hypothetical protein